MKPYHLHYWGGVQNDGLSAKFLGTDKQDFWFDTAQERQEFKGKLESFAKDNGAIVCFSEHDGVAAQARTVAVMVLKVGGKEYPYEHDFGVGYPEESAQYMFEDGNYGCDCNRSLFLSRQYPDVAEIDQCGETIEMVSFKVERRPVATIPAEGA